jgi:LuxR family maltose regulon positive regulatory protein
VIEILVLQSLARDAVGDHAGAIAALERAVSLAAPEGYVRIFLDEGAALVRVLRAARTVGSPTYVDDLLAAFGPGDDRVRRRQPLMEPLTKRELDVLRLLRTDLNGPDVARELVLSLHTVRSHTKSIYAKLGVNNRRAAVRRADELDLLAPPR